ncbi:hypothetical protein [Pseudonocardia sp. WMMC193]|uniref:hypothetical protein n=1 Tax=Pseudonocardia sp. WMMC193 TaxID=2911965 RepID=UPI001F2C0B43|nr:hypothetical protein [Pseudonocardia sp. WMMC193]MCF7552592.1 hypothetical protein [Pseudonocardia sp. WMMC193]
MTTTVELRQRALLDQLDAASETTRAHLVALADDLGGSEPAYSTRRSTRMLDAVEKAVAADPVYGDAAHMIKFEASVVGSRTRPPRRR